VSDKIKFPLLKARHVAERIVRALAPACERIEIAGSIRRQKSEVGDIEILYIPKMVSIRSDLFNEDPLQVPAVDAILEKLLLDGSLAKRKTIKGTENWGPSNKYAVAVRSGIPVDFFCTDEKCWWNMLVCRTGSAETNQRIAAAAKAQGKQWHPCGPGFSQKFPGHIEYYPMTSERGVFTFAGLPYLEPAQR